MPLACTNVAVAAAVQRQFAFLLDNMDTIVIVMFSGLILAGRQSTVQVTAHAVTAIHHDQ